MHRYVALIANSEAQELFDQLARRLARRFTDWRCALDVRRAKAWVTADPQSPIGFTSYGPSGCLIGVQLGDRRPELLDGAAGEGLLARSWGAYVAIRIGDGREINIVREPSGRIPCWTACLSGADVYVSNIDDVPEMKEAPTDPIDWDYIQYHLTAGGVHGRQTGLKSVAELLPGRQVRYSGGPGREASAWPIADIVAAPFESQAAAEAGLRAAAAETVGAWARRYDRITLDLSGGFDSAVLLGLIREQAPGARVLAINYLTAHPEGDERAYAQAAADHHAVPLLVEALSTEGRHFDLDRARHWLRPSIKALPLGGIEERARAATTIDAQAAFSGIGGDQVFGHNVPPSMLADAVQDRLALPALLTLAHDYAKMSQDTLWNIGWANIIDLLKPRRALKALLQTPNPYVTKDCMEGANFERFAHPDLLEVGERLSSAKIFQLITFHGLNSSYWRYGREFQPDEVNPFQSQLVLEASLRIPSYWMNPDGRRRGLARRAFRHVLPDAILKRRCKSTITTHAMQVLANNRQFLRELMLEGHLVSHGLLDKKKLEIALSPQIFLQTKFSGFARSVATELWIQSTMAGLTPATQEDRLRESADSGI